MVYHHIIWVVHIPIRRALRPNMTVGTFQAHLRTPQYWEQSQGPLATTYWSSLHIYSLPNSNISPSYHSIFMKHCKILFGSPNWIDLCTPPYLTPVLDFLSAYNCHTSLYHIKENPIFPLVHSFNTRPWNQLLLHKIHRTPLSDAPPFHLLQV